MAQIDPTYTQRIVGQRLRWLRETANKKLSQAAIEAGVSPGTLAKIEDGESNFRILTLTKLCNYYHVTLEDLMNDTSAGLLEKSSSS
jgi:transcriptional regulator with XRE-family HTH domain